MRRGRLLDVVAGLDRGDDLAVLGLRRLALRVRRQIIYAARLPLLPSRAGKCPAGLVSAAVTHPGRGARETAVACGSNKATREMVVSMGGLAVRSALEQAASRRDALAEVLGRSVAGSSVAPLKLDYYVTQDGSRVRRTNGGADRTAHVHVIPWADGDRNKTVVQLTDRSAEGVRASDTGRRHQLRAFDGRGHLERIELYSMTGRVTQADIAKAEAELLGKLRSRRQSA